MAKDAETAKIMLKPLPDILDELEAMHNENAALIEELRELIKEGKEAIRQTRLAGEKASEAAIKAVEKAAVKIREDTTAMIASLGNDMRQEALAVDRALLAAKEKHIAESPLLKEP
jgi:hypothetical protein